MKQNKHYNDFIRPNSKMFSSFFFEEQEIRNYAYTVQEVNLNTNQEVNLNTN